MPITLLPRPVLFSQAAIAAGVFLALFLSGSSSAQSTPLPFQQQIKITAKDAKSGDQFGARVAISRDIAVVGANRDAVDGKADQGAAYVFVRKGATWTQQVRLTASDGVAGDQFGAAVAIDGNTIVVGARYADFHDGKAYVFTRDGRTGVWAEQRLPRNLYPGAAGFPGFFGDSVGISGNIIVVGNPQAHGAGNASTGIVHIFVLNGARWTFQTQLSGFTGGGLFGASVAISRSTILVGDPGAYFATPDDPNHPLGIVKGAAYVFTATGSSWTRQQQLYAPDGEDRDLFGQAVALDVDSAIVGAPGDDINGHVDQGSISIWGRKDNVWSEQFAITGADSVAGDNFGFDVSIRGSTAIAGALFHAVGSNTSQGAAYVFSRDAGRWSQADEVVAKDGSSNDRFGAAVALTNRTAIVGAFGSAGLSGAAYVSELLDSDGDGIPDEWEKHGITVDDNGIVSIGNTGNGVFVDLPKMGANPNHKDVFVHADWMGPDPSRPAAIFKPDRKAIKIVIDAFARAPIDNPDGFRGINLHVDLGPSSVLNYVTGATTTWGKLSRAAEVPFQSSIPGYVAPTATSEWSFNWSAVDSIKAANFSKAKRDLVFHYCLFGNNFTPMRNGGISKGIGASDFIVTLGDWEDPGGTLLEQAGTFMHELGHNLGLEHGGDDDINNKPNYISVMNYSFANLGVFQPLGIPRRFDYSTAALPSLDERHLDEFVGINDPAMHLTFWNQRTRIDSAGSNVCLDKPSTYYKQFFPTDALDWNCDGEKTTSAVVADINSDGDCVRINDADGIATQPAGDDIEIGGIITAGPNRICETKAVGDDEQLQRVGFVQPDILPGFNDWPALRFDGDGTIGASLGPPPEQISTDGNEPSLKRIREFQPDAVRQEEFVSPSDVVVVSQESGSASSFKFDGSSSTAVTGTIVSYAWDFGDSSTGTGATASHTYSAPGVYFATLTVTDSNGHVNLVPLVERVTVTASTAASGQLLNISTRLRALTGENVLIGGFIVTGTEPKKVLIRGIGPSLGSSGLQGVLADPTLELHQGSSTLATNDNWKKRSDGSSQQAEIEGTTIPPTNDLESAIVATLAPGAYTAILAGKGGTSGIALVEVYDLAQAANSKLANISTRGFVDKGDNVMIGGFIVGGTSADSAKVIVRAIGPSLPVDGKLADPTLELHDSNGAVIASNDNWRSAQEAEIIATTVPPSNNLESAIVSTLTPGAYTAVVRGVNETTGVGLVEVFRLQ